MKMLFLSPHYDDAIYSCGATIYKRVRQGNQVTILTVMAGIPTPPFPETPVLNVNHQRWQAGDNPVLTRREEDRLAASILGARVEYLDILDCIYRTADGKALYATEDSLWGSIHPADEAPGMLDNIALDAYDFVYAPLGVGEHVDHLIVRNWGIQLADSRVCPVKFYVEYPYCRHPKPVRRAYQSFPGRLSPMQILSTENDVHAKIQAMTAYRSQIASFWPDESAIGAEVRETFTRENKGFVEEFANLQ